MPVINYFRVCAYCGCRGMVKGFRRMPKGWACPDCVAKLVGPLECCYCHQPITDDQIRMRIRMRVTGKRDAHATCYAEHSAKRGTGTFDAALGVVS